MRARAELLAILLAILVASCGPAPHGVDVTVAGESAPTVVGSTAYWPFLGLLLSPVVAAAAMSFSSVSLIGNALRLRSARV